MADEASLTALAIILPAIVTLITMAGKRRYDQAKEAADTRLSGAQANKTNAEGESVVIGGYKQLVCDLEKQVDRLRQDLEERGKEWDAQEERRDSQLVAMQAEFRAAADDWKRREASLTNQIHGLTLEVQTLSTQLRQKQTQADHLDRLVASLRRQVEDLRAALAAERLRAQRASE